VVPSRSVNEIKRESHCEMSARENVSFFRTSNDNDVFVIGVDGEDHATASQTKTKRAEHHVPTCSHIIDTTKCLNITKLVVGSLALMAGRPPSLI